MENKNNKVLIEAITSDQVKSTPQKVNDAITTSQIQPTRPMMPQQMDTYAMNTSQIIQSNGSTKKEK